MVCVQPEASEQNPEQPKIHATQLKSETRPKAQPDPAMRPNSPHEPTVRPEAQHELAIRPETQHKQPKTIPETPPKQPNPSNESDRASHPMTPEQQCHSEPENPTLLSIERPLPLGDDSRLNPDLNNHDSLPLDDDSRIDYDLNHASLPPDDDSRATHDPQNHRSLPADDDSRIKHDLSHDSLPLDNNSRANHDSDHNSPPDEHSRPNHDSQNHGLLPTDDDSRTNHDPNHNSNYDSNHDSNHDSLPLADGSNHELGSVVVDHPSCGDGPAPEEPQAAKTESSEDFKLPPEDDGSVAEAPDGGWGWLIVFAVFLIHICVFGTIYSFGVFFVAFINEFNTGEGETAWVGSLAFGGMFLLGPTAGKFVARFGHRRCSFFGSLVTVSGVLATSFASEFWQLFVFFSLPLGIGFSFLFISGVTIVQVYFDKRRGLATGLAVSGSGCGTFILGPVCRALIEAIGWRHSLRVLAGLIFVLTSLSSTTYTPLQIRRKPGAPPSKDFSLKWLLKQPPFHFLFLAQLFAALGYNVPFVHLVNHAEQQGIPSPALVLTVVGASSACGRVFLGRMADRLGRLEVMAVSLFLAGLGTCFMGYATTFEALVPCCLAFGIFSGAFIALQPVLLADFFGSSNLPQILGVVNFVVGIVMMVGAPIAGWIQEATKTYALPFLLAGLVMVSSGPLLGSLKLPCFNRTSSGIT